MARGAPVRQAVESYLAVRRAAGFDLTMVAYILRSFARFAEERGETHIRTATAIDWASQAASVAQRDTCLKTVVRFAQHMHLEDTRHEVPPRAVFGYRKTRRVPFIYTPTDLHCLLAAAAQLGPPASLRPHTYTTLIALLAATGLRISEALALRLDDCTAEGLLIRKTKFQKTRLVPLHPTAAAGLQRYLVRRQPVAIGDDHIFLSHHGYALARLTIYSTFQRLLQKTGLSAGRGGHRPWGVATFVSSCLR
jgi:integrase/recombinase XerD